MLKKIFVVAFFFLFWVTAPTSEAKRPVIGQDEMAVFKNNECVNCHSRLTSPIKMSGKYAEWHMSVHKIKGVGCEKCHGGNPGAEDQKKAHDGVLPPADANSRVFPKNVPDTCNACHQPFVSNFIESKHYQNLKTVGIGPSCSTCHAHMASEVMYTPEQTSELCASCHNSTNAMMPKRPEIPEKAAEAMTAIRRANMVVGWADRLLEEAEKRKMDVADDQKEMKVVHAMLIESKAGFHAFNLEVVRAKADAAFEQGTKLKDSLRKKLYPNQ